MKSSPGYTPDMNNTGPLQAAHTPSAISTIAAISQPSIPSKSPVTCEPQAKSALWSTMVDDGAVTDWDPPTWTDLSPKQISPPPLNDDDTEDETTPPRKKSLVEMYTQIFQTLFRRTPQTLRQSAETNALFKRHIQMYMQHEEKTENGEGWLMKLLEHVPNLEYYIPINDQPTEATSTTATIFQIPSHPTTSPVTCEAPVEEPVIHIVPKPQAELALPDTWINETAVTEWDTPADDPDAYGYYPGDPIYQGWDINSQYEQYAGYWQNCNYGDVAGYVDCYGFAQPFIYFDGPMFMGPDGYMYPTYVPHVPLSAIFY
jgi:hypothetical protein